MKILKLWLPVFLWAGIIFFLSSLPDLKTDLKEDFILRKIAHVIEYLVFTFLLFRAFNGSFKMNPRQLFMYPAAFTLVYAISDEFHQYFVRGRVCSMHDVLVDSIGIISFYILIRMKKGCPCSIK